MKFSTVAIIGGIYQHYKNGKLYRVLEIAKHSETLEMMVVYEALYDNLTSKIWVRPLSMFEDPVKVGRKSVPRFSLKGKL